MRRFLTIAIPIVTIVLFVCIMQSTTFLKKPFGEEKDVTQVFDDMFQDLEDEVWDDVSRGVEDLEDAWETVSSRLQFSVEKEEINKLSNNIARLTGAVQANDKTNTLIELHEAYNNWNNIDK